MDERGGRVGLVAVRDSRRSGLQVLLSPSSGAAARAGAASLSFPQGGIDSGDRAPAILRRCHALAAAEARRLLGSAMTSAHAMGHWVAAARLLLAATGLLLAVEGQHRAPAQRRVPPRQRHALSGTGADFADYLIREELHCDLGRLSFFTQWAAPESGDATRFFLVKVPDNLRGAGSVWRAPDKALLLWRDGALTLDFATFAGLRVLTDFSSCDSLLSENSCPVSNKTL